MLQVEENQGIKIEGLLRRMFVDENKSLHSMTEELKISYPVVISWLKQAGIYSRKLRVMETEKKGFRKQ